VAALPEFVVGEGKEPVTIVPSTDDFAGLKRAIAAGGTIVIMKIGERLKELLKLLAEEKLLDAAVLVSRAGMAGQRIETDLRRLTGDNPEIGYLSIILVDAGRGKN